jgi:hypothetical protein
LLIYDYTFLRKAPTKDDRATAFEILQLFLENPVKKLPKIQNFFVGRKTKAGFREVSLSFNHWKPAKKF